MKAWIFWQQSWVDDLLPFLGLNQSLLTASVRFALCEKNCYTKVLYMAASTVMCVLLTAWLLVCVSRPAATYCADRQHCQIVT